MRFLNRRWAAGSKRTGIFAAFTCIAFAAKPIHSDGQRLVRFRPKC